LHPAYLFQSPLEVSRDSGIPSLVERGFLLAPAEPMIDFLGTRHRAGEFAVVIDRGLIDLFDKSRVYVIEEVFEHRTPDIWPMTQAVVFPVRFDKSDLFGEIPENGLFIPQRRQGQLAGPGENIPDH
jgi:hypothetical protein